MMYAILQPWHGLGLGQSTRRTNPPRECTRAASTSRARGRGTMRRCLLPARTRTPACAPSRPPRSTPRRMREPRAQRLQLGKLTAGPMDRITTAK